MTAPVFTLYRVPRRCTCGTEWVGNAFTPLADGEPTPRPGMCAACVERGEARQLEMTRRAPAQGQPMPKPRPTREREPGEEEQPEPWWNR